MNVAGGTSGRKRISGSNFSSSSCVLVRSGSCTGKRGSVMRCACRICCRSLQHALFFVVALSARMKRNAGAGDGAARLYGLAFGMTGIELLSRVVVPQRFGDFVDKRIGLFGRRDP